MLLEIGLKNFKAFGDVEQAASCSKITLLYGPNSSGKSSIIQALLMLKQSALEAGNAATIWGLVTRGEYVDLGGYPALLHRHELNRRLGINFEFGQDKHRVGVRMAFAGVTDVDEKGREYQEDSAILSEVTYRMTRNQQVLVKASLENDGGSWWKAHMSSANASVDGKVLDFSGGQRFLPELKFLELELLLERNQSALPEGARGLVRERATSRRLERGEARKRFQALAGMSTRELNRLPPIDRDLDRAREAMRALSRRAKPDLVRALEQGLTPKQMLQLKAIPDTVAGQLEAVRYLGPLRSHPERLYGVSGVSSYISGSRGEFAAQRLYYQPGLVHSVNEWLDKFDIGYRLDVERIGDMAVSGEHIALVLEDKGTKTRVTLADVGFGVNQLLPVVVEGVDWFTAGKDRVLCVEQPEIHLHPRLQARLADLMIETIQGRGRKQWIVETHSELLVLRMQRRIREGKLDPADVSVLYVRPDTTGGGSSTIQKLRLDDKGDFVDYWPDGFFEESFGEVMM